MSCDHLKKDKETSSCKIRRMALNPIFEPFFLFYGRFSCFVGIRPRKKKKKKISPPTPPPKRPPKPCAPRPLLGNPPFSISRFNGPPPLVASDSFSLSPLPRNRRKNNKKYLNVRQAYFWGRAQNLDFRPFFPIFRLFRAGGPKSIL